MRRRECRRSLEAFCTDALRPLGQTPAAHHRLLIQNLEAVARGDCDRLMVLMPPGSAKSTYTSTLFPAWWFAQHPMTSVIAGSHTLDLARRFGRKVRNTIGEQSAVLGYGISSDSYAADRFATDGGGEYVAMGVGGSVTGRRADLLLIDDPVASREDADSETARESTWEWYRNDAYTRLKPGGRIVLIMTRWHEDDIGGRLLAEMENGADQWTVLRLPALAEPADPLGRVVGEPLWPEWENEAALLRKRAAVGERAWGALYQQNPRPLEGGLFHGPVTTHDAVAVGGTIVRAWDLAATAQVGSGDPDWTVGTKLARYPDGSFVVLDVVRFRGGPEIVEQRIKATASGDGTGVRIGLPQDPGQAGKAQVLNLTRMLAGYRVESSPETGSKETRAAPVAAQVNVGNVSMVRAAWNPTFLDELRGFPNAAKDDQVDALSRAFAMLIAPPPPTRAINIPILAR